VRPVVKSAMRRLWRDQETLQIGLDPRRALVVSGIHPGVARLLSAFDGAHTDDDLRRAARRFGMDPGDVDRLVAMLVDAAVVDDGGRDADGSLAMRGLPVVERDRLAPDLSSLSLVTGALDGGATALSDRRGAVVGVVGAGRVGASVCTLLAAAGVGRVVVDDGQPCRPRDCAPSGAAVADVGASRAQAARAAMHRASSGVDTRALRRDERFDVVVVAPSEAEQAAVADDLLRSGTPHLFATVREATGVVGPFVLPGRTACLRCLDLHRTDRDPAWPLLAAQLASEPARVPTEACDVVLATLVASVCALNVLNFLGGTPPVGNATFEATLPDWRLRRRSWSLHPACGCHWFGDEGAISPASAGAAQLHRRQ
jgi:molybdopterin/thiamine biosynthesis adenylyltransferase